MSTMYGKRNQIITNGLMLNLDAADKKSYPGTGNIWYDISGNNRNAVIFGATNFNSQYSGRFQYLLGQATDYISLPASALRATGANYTIEFWMQPKLFSSTRYFHSVSNGSDHNYMLMYHSAAGNIRFFAGGTDIPYTNDEIIHLCIVRNSSDTGTIYKNAYTFYSSTNVTQVNAAADGGWILNQDQDSVGGSFDGTQNYLGSFMSIRVYNRALSESEIKQNFNAVRTRYGV